MIQHCVVEGIVQVERYFILVYFISINPNSVLMPCAKCGSATSPISSFEHYLLNFPFSEGFLYLIHHISSDLTLLSNIQACPETGIVSVATVGGVSPIVMLIVAYKVIWSELGRDVIANMIEVGLYMLMTILIDLHRTPFCCTLGGLVSLSRVWQVKY